MEEGYSKNYAKKYGGRSAGKAGKQEDKQSLEYQQVDLVNREKYKLSKG